MEIIFDINEEELPIFLAEVDEHLQALDDVLLRLDKGEPTPTWCRPYSVQRIPSRACLA